MEHKVFSLKHLKGLVDSNRFDEANEYIKEYFFNSGAKVYFRNGNTNQFVLYSDVDALKLISNDLVATENRYGQKVVIYNAKKFLASTDFKALDYIPTIDFSTEEVKFTKPNRGGVPINYINMAKPKPSFDSIQADRTRLKDELNFVYTHIKTVWANDDTEIYNWILNFLACSMTGKRKLRQCLYLPCNTERAGRGSILNFINAIIGERMYKTSSTEELLKYNKNFEGRSLINFDELPTDGGSFRSVSDTLKALITEPTFPCRDMYNKPYEQKNTFNIIITSNNEAVRITQSNNSRYMICNINTCRVGQHDYFVKLNRILKKPEIQKLFYEDMEGRIKKCEKWNEDMKPFSIAKQEKLIETLPRVLKFIKENCVLKGKGIDMKTSEFFSWYSTRGNDKTSKQKINKELKKVNIVARKIRKGDDTFTCYSISAGDLLEAYQKNGFIDDELECVENDGNDDDIETAIVDDLKKQLDEMKLKYEQLQAKCEELEKPRKKVVVKGPFVRSKTTNSVQRQPKDVMAEPCVGTLRKEADAMNSSCDEDDLSVDF